MADVSLGETITFTTDPARIEEAAMMLRGLMTEAVQTDLLESSRTLNQVIDAYELLKEPSVQ